MARMRNKGRLNVLLTGDPLKRTPYPIDEALLKYTEIVFWESKESAMKVICNVGPIEGLEAQIMVVGSHGGRVRYHTFGPKDTKPKKMVEWS